METQLLFQPFNISGPTFLLIYFLILLTVWFLLFFIRRVFDSAQTDTFSGKQPDPYEIACLRGGMKEVMKLAAYRLVSTDMFKVKTDKNLSQVNLQTIPHHKNSKNLHEPERILINYFQHDGETNLEKVLRDKNARREMNDHCKSIFQSLEEKNLIWSQKNKRTYRTVKTLLILLLIALAVGKIIYALSNGHSNILFLCLMALIGTIIIGLTNKIPATTKTGAEYLKTLQTTYQFSSGRVEGMDPSLEFLMVAVFGTMILQGTSFGYMHDYSDRHLASIGSSGCSSSSYSSGSDSSGGDSGGDGGSCGGGCGGCGGGGD